MLSPQDCSDSSSCFFVIVRAFADRFLIVKVLGVRFLRDSKLLKSASPRLARSVGGIVEAIRFTLRLHHDLLLLPIFMRTCGKSALPQIHCIGEAGERTFGIC